VSGRALCETCGVAVIPDAAFCEECGARVAPVADDPGATPRCHVCGSGADVLGTDGYCTVCGAREAAERERVELNLGIAAAVSDAGLVHHRNDDAFHVAAVDTDVAVVVCDGVSTSVLADLAARRAADAAGVALVDSLRDGVGDSASAIRDAAAAARRAVLELDGGSRDGAGPACTLVAALWRAGWISVGWLGDSRAYWLSDEAAQLTVDDSWAGEQVLAGNLSEEEAAADPRARSITRWVGADAPTGAPRVVSLQPEAPGLLLLCSDGLSLHAPRATDVARLVRQLPDAASPIAVARSLTDTALAAGGEDNVTVVVVDVQPHRR
jgi:serine/threonine protein phosphatase PrpC